MEADNNTASGLAFPEATFYQSNSPARIQSQSNATTNQAETLNQTLAPNVANCSASLFSQTHSNPDQAPVSDRVNNSSLSLRNPE